MSKVFVLGEFTTPAPLCDAIRKLREKGYTEIDAHAPYPVHEIEHALELPRSPIRFIVGGGAATGVSVGFLMQWWCNTVAYPIEIGGRPLFSWPQWIPITFELGILLGVLGAFFGVFALMGLPQPYHPLFEVEGFRRATIDRFWVSIALDVPSVDDEKTKELTQTLSALGAAQVSAVEEPR